jgi:predicted Co/Zn/Cd cation transporter (cation efflux family)
MKIDWSFLRLVVLCFAGAALLTYYPISEFATMEVTRSIIAGGVMSLINLLLGYLAIEVSFERSHTTFLKFVLGGMVGRLLLMWGILLLLICVYDFHSASLMLSLLFFYALNLALEIYYLQKRVSTK